MITQVAHLRAEALRSTFAEAATRRQVRRHKAHKGESLFDFYLPANQIVKRITSANQACLAVVD